MKRNSAVFILSMLFIMFIAGGCATTGNGGAGGPGGAVSGGPSVTAVLTGLAITEDAVEIKASGPFTYTVYKASDPYRVTVELPDVNIGSFKDKVTSAKGSISEVMPSQAEAPKLIAKLDILLHTPAEIEPLYKDNVLVLKTTGKAMPAAVITEAPKAVAATAGPEAAAPVPAEKAAVEETGKAAETAKDTIVAAEQKAEAPKKEETAKDGPKKEEAKKEEIAQPLKKATDITDLVFESSNGSLTFVIKGNGYLKPEVFTLKNRIVIDLPGAALKAKVPSAVTAPVKSVRAGKHKDRTRLVIDLVETRAFEALSVRDTVTITLKDADVPALVAKKENNKVSKTQLKDKKDRELKKEELVQQTSDKKADKQDMPDKPDKAEAVEPVKPLEKELAEESAGEANKTQEAATPPAVTKPVAKAREAAVPVAAPTAPAAIPAEAKEKEADTLAEGKFTGTKISLDFQDADILPIFRLLTDISGFNIVVNPEVKGKLTMKLINVPWDQALDIILKTFSLGKRVDGNIIRIAPMTTFAKEDADKAAAKEAEYKAEPMETRVLPISYADVSVVETTIKGSKILTPRGSLSVDKRTSSMVIKDVVSVFPQVEQLLKTLDKPTPQVMIEARIVEVNTSDVRDLGIQWGLNFNAANTLATVGGLSGLGKGAFTGGNYLVDFPGGAATGSGSGFTFGVMNPDKTMGLDLQLSAIQTTGKGKIISNPKIMTVDNAKAFISQGDSIPIRKLTDQGTISTDFKDYTLSLTVTPHITPDNSISMVIEAKKEEPDWTRVSSEGTPASKKREANTNVIIKDGETIVIGGVFKTSSQDTDTGTPGLMDIPFLKWLFKKNKVNEDTSEMLIFITPRIIVQK